MTQYIQLQQTPSQVFNIVLNEQNCTLKIYQKRGKTFSSLYIDDKVIFEGILIHSFQGFKPANYLNFDGDLAFFDLYGSDDPDFNKYNDRFELNYLTNEEYEYIFN